MTLSILFKKLLFLLIILPQSLFSASYTSYQAPSLPIQTINHEINYNTILYNTGKTLGDLFINGSLMPYFTIQKFTNGLYVWYYYNTRFDSNTPSLVGTYNLKISTDGVSVFPEIIGYYPRTPFFDPSLSCKHSASTAYHYLQPLTEVVSQPIMHPIIEDTLKGRWEALIEVLQKDNSTRQESSSTNATWIKILKVVCQDFNYPFTALDLSFPTKEDAENAPRYTPYAPEDEIKKMEKELSLESTSTERKEFLRNEILFFREFLADLEKGNKDVHYGTLSSQKIVPTLPPSTKITALTPTTPIKEISTKQQPVGLSTIPEEVVSEVALIKTPNLQLAEELVPLSKTEQDQNQEAAKQESLLATKAAQQAEKTMLLGKKQLEKAQKALELKRREEQAQKDREAAKKQKEAAQQTEELAKKTVAIKTVQKTKIISAAATVTHKTKSTPKGAAAAGRKDSDNDFLEEESKRVAKETAIAAFAIIHHQQEKSLSSSLSTPSFEKDFEEFYKKIHSLYSEPRSKAQTQQLIKDFYKKTSTKEQIYFVFNHLSDKPELALFYETLHNITTSEEPLSFMSQAFFEDISKSFISATKPYIIKLNTAHNTFEEQTAAAYLQRIYLLAESVYSRPLQTNTFVKSRFASSINGLFNAYKAFNDDKTSKEAKIAQTPKLKTSIKKIIDSEREKVKTAIFTFLETIKTESDVREFITSFDTFSANEFYKDVRSNINAYLAEQSEEEKRHWYLYTILPDYSQFPSLAPCLVPGSFLIRCNCFKKELETYLTKAPNETEVFKATEELITKFLNGTQNPQALGQFISVFEKSPILFFCINGLLTDRTPPSVTIPFFNYLKKYLVVQMNDIKTTCLTALRVYLEETYSKMEVYLQQHTPRTVIEFSSLNMGAAIPFETVFNQFKVDINAFSGIQETEDLIPFKEVFIAQLFERIHTLADLKMIMEETINDDINGPFYCRSFLEFLEKKTIAIPTTVIADFIAAFKPKFNKHIRDTFSIIQVKSATSEMTPAKNAYFSNYIRYLQKLQTKMQCLCDSIAPTPQEH